MEEKSFFYRYCIIFPEEYLKIVNYFIEILKQNNFDIQSFTENKNIYLCLSQTNEKMFLITAEKLRIRKKTNILNPELNELPLPKEIIELEKEEPFRVKEKDKFIPDKHYEELYDTLLNKNQENQKRFGLDIFTEIEMLSIEKTILRNIIIPNIEELKKLIDEIKPELKINENEYLIEKNSLYKTLLSTKIIKDHFPLHISNFSEKIIRKTIYSIYCPYTLIRSYFNEQVALYFAWFDYYTRFLLIPSIFNCLVYISNKIFSIKNTSFIYAMLMSIWINIFIIFWNRKTQELKIKWNNYTEEYDRENRREEFKGEWSKSLITGEFEIHFSKTKRFIKYIDSFIISIPILFLAILLNIISLNLIGSIKDEDNSIFHIKFLSDLTKENQIFEKGTFYSNCISFLQPMFISSLNSLYNSISLKTTEMENHKVKSTFDNSLIYKRFCFEFINNFYNIFYLAFIVKDIEATISTLKGLFYFSEIQRLVSQTLIPSIEKFIFENVYLILFFKGGDEDKFLLGKEIDKEEVLRQEKLIEYNTYNDYLPIIIEFGYLTLFSEFFPFASLILFFSNFIELKSDIISIGFNLRRPQFIRKRNIGAWENIINVISVLSIISNLIFSYYFSSYVYKYKYDILVNFTIWEHAIVILIIILRFSFSNTPYWVKIFLLRRDYKEKHKNIKED